MKQRWPWMLGVCSVLLAMLLGDGLWMLLPPATVVAGVVVFVNE